MSVDRVVALDDPQLRAVAPLIYVAWSDFDLDEEERQRVLAAMASQPWLRPAARAVIEAWIDPDRPPHAEELAQLRTLIDRVGSRSATPRRGGSSAAPGSRATPRGSSRLATLTPRARARSAATSTR